MRRLTSLKLAFAAMIAAAACGGDSGTDIHASAVSSVTLSSASLSVGLGATALLDAYVRDATNSLITSPDVDWTSSNTSVATVDATGHVRGVALGGPVNITATSGGKTASASITVTPDSVSITPGISVLNIGASVQLTATAYDHVGNVLNAGATDWTAATSGPTPAVSITPSGLLSAIAPSPAFVYATIAGKRGQLNVGVPSTYDGLWVGTNTSGSRAVQFTVLYGWVTAFRIPSIPIQLCTVLQVNLTPNVFIQDAKFTFPLTFAPNTATGTFTDGSSLSGNVGNIFLGQITCDDGQIQPGLAGITLGAYTATKQ